MEVVKVETHHYTLTPKSALNRLSPAAPRAGCLLRVSFAGFERPGHADLFPWPELGDLPLGLQLETLREGTPLPLAAASVLWAFEEAKAIQNGEAFFPGDEIPSHRTLVDRAAMTADCRLAKMKITQADVDDWASVEKWMMQFPRAQWRLDFNGLFTDLAAAEKFWTRVSPAVRERIDFLEDPVCEDLMAAPILREAFGGARIAVDRSTSPGARKNADVMVLKPVTYSPEVLTQEALAFPGEIVVTSMMDHPVGQLTALRGAQLLYASIGDQLSTAGLLTHDLYDTHPASGWVRTEGDLLRATHAGPGLGVSAQLAALSWETLV